MQTMAEYIEREEVLKHKRKMSGADFGGEFWDEAVLCEDIRKIPTADVVPVVRCKDCKYYKAQKQSVNWKNKKKYCCRVVALKVNENDYCSYGKRKCE